MVYMGLCPCKIHFATIDQLKMLESKYYEKEIQL